MNKTTILTDEEVKKLAEKAAKIIFGKENLEGINYKERFEDYIRLMSLGAKCKEVRGKLEFSLKDASAKFKIPQYRIKAIEESQRREILPEILAKYVAFLELESWFEKWKDANPALAQKLCKE